jgi:integrase
LSINDRKHLTTDKVDKLMAAIKGSRNETRDRCLPLLMIRHGLRVSEACGLDLSQVDIESRVLHVARLEKGLLTTHPLRPDFKVIKVKKRIKKINRGDHHIIRTPPACPSETVLLGAFTIFMAVFPGANTGRCWPGGHQR